VLPFEAMPTVDDPLQQKFGDIIRRRRKEIGLGQEAYADKAGLHRTHVSLIERGQRMPSLLVIKKLAAGLETSMASLMEELERGESPRSKKKRD
jgi:transcriptional regulator with XRE-family HTH domain